MRTSPILALFLMSIAFGIITASSFNYTAVLQSYNVSSALVSSLTPVTINYSGAHYVALYSSGKLYFLINEDNGMFITNASSIAAIITPYTLQKSYSLANFASLYAMMHTYQQSSAAPLSDCLNETGLSRGFTCTLSNYCNSCQVVPSCNEAMYQTDGPTGPIGTGIMQLESQYTILNNSLNTFYNDIKTMNATSAPGKVSSMESAFKNISTITLTIYQNPLFPPTSNITSAQLSQCIYYTSSMPWYCDAVGYCQFLTYNYTLLGSIKSQMNYISTLPFSSQQIMSIAQGASSIESQYITKVIGSRQKLLYENISSTVLANYSSLVNNSIILLSHIKNATLENDLMTAQEAYSNLTSNYLTLNLTSFKKILSADISNLSKAYSLVNSTYNGMLSEAANNTALLINMQLNQQTPSASESELALSQFRINNELSGYVSNAINVSTELYSINAEAKSLYSSSVPISLTELARFIDSPFIEATEPSTGNYLSNVSSAPAYASMLSLIIGIVLILIVYVFYAYAKAKKLIAAYKKDVVRNWHILFAIAIVVVAIYVLLTYVYALGANSFAPYTAFFSAVRNAHSVAILENGQGTYSCASSISNALSSMKKNSTIYTMSGNACISGTTTINNCMSYFAAHGIPMFIISNSSGSSINIYSFYGTYMYYAGNESYISSCYPSLLLR